MSDLPSVICLWLPRKDEHALARSLGMIERTPEEMQQIISAIRAEWEPKGVAVKVGRWHVWRVVRTIHRLGSISTPDGRAAAFGFLGTSSEGEDQS